MAAATRQNGGKATVNELRIDADNFPAHTRGMATKAAANVC
jgi:hypothetical protein